MKYYQKRGRWCVSTEEGTKKFATEEEAKGYVTGTKTVPFVENIKLGIAVDSVDFDQELLEDEEEQDS